VDRKVIEIDSLDSRFCIAFCNGDVFYQDLVPLVDLRDILISDEWTALLVRARGLDREDSHKYITLTIFPDSILNMISNDTEVLLV